MNSQSTNFLLGEYLSQLTAFITVINGFPDIHEILLTEHTLINDLTCVNIVGGGGGGGYKLSQGKVRGIDLTA